MIKILRFNSEDTFINIYFDKAEKTEIGYLFFIDNVLVGNVLSTMKLKFDSKSDAAVHFLLK